MRNAARTTVSVRRSSSRPRTVTAGTVTAGTFTAGTIATAMAIAALSFFGATTGRAEASDTVEVGGACAPGARSIDTTGRRVQCITSSYARFWAWSDPIGKPVPEVVPGSWSSITADVSGPNAVPASAPIAPQFADRQAMAERYVEIVNEWRASKGIAALTIDNRLAHLGKFWAERLGTGEYPGGIGSHCPRSLCAMRISELGYSSMGEVIRPWTPIPTGDLTAERYFIDSPAHYAILTDPKFTHIGMAFHVVADASGRPQSMVVVGELGRSR